MGPRRLVGRCLQVTVYGIPFCGIRRLRRFLPSARLVCGVPGAWLSNVKGAFAPFGLRAGRPREFTAGMPRNGSPLLF